jgi:hypothetical protein
MKAGDCRSVQFISTEMKRGEYEFSLVTMKGKIPSGSEGNIVVEQCFAEMSESINLLESPSPFVVYDCVDMAYGFGDHLGAFFWVLPALLDNIGIIVAARAESLPNMKGLANFIGPWLPILFMESIEAIWSQLDEDGLDLRNLLDKTMRCRNLVRLGQGRYKPVPIVILGSRQTGRQFKSGNRFNRTSDVDYATIGGGNRVFSRTVQRCFLQDRIPQNCREEFPTFAGVNSPEMQRPL